MSMAAECTSRERQGALERYFARPQDVMLDSVDWRAAVWSSILPYRGEAPALTDLIAGQAQLMVSTTGSSLQYARAGTVRALATTTDDRVAELPDVPPLSKTLPGYRANAWSGLCAPKGTPAEIITLLNEEVNLAMADAKIKERMSSLGGVALPGSPEDYGRTIVADTATWGQGRAVLRRQGAVTSANMSRPFRASRPLRNVRFGS